MKSLLPILPLLLLPLVGLCESAAATDLSKGSVTTEIPEYHPESPGAPPVTADTLLRDERFWPYQVSLPKDWQAPERAQPLPSGSTGVLIRVEAGGRDARVDFGRDGLYEVPVSETDLVDRANLVRRGEFEKLAPNFVLAVGPRLLDSGTDPLRPLTFEAVFERRRFLCAFADPNAEGFPALAETLAPLEAREGLLTIFFPQGKHSDAALRDQLRRLGWKPAFMSNYLSEAYARTLLPDGAAPPFVLLQTSEGQVLFQGSWKADVAPRIKSALDRADGATPAR